MTAADANVPWLKVEGYPVEARQIPWYRAFGRAQVFCNSRDAPLAENRRPASYWAAIMTGSAADLVQAFIQAFKLGDARRLAPFLSEDISARFEDTGTLYGQRTVLDFWRRLFQSYAQIDVRISKVVTEEGVVIAELLYGLHLGRGKPVSVRTIAVFEVRDDLILSWVDHADLTDVPSKQRDLWHRLSAARW